MTEKIDFTTVGLSIVSLLGIIMIIYEFGRLYSLSRPLFYICYVATVFFLLGLNFVLIFSLIFKKAGLIRIEDISDD
jgi:hypothetical protein